MTLPQDLTPIVRDWLHKPPRNDVPSPAITPSPVVRELSRGRSCMSATSAR